MGERNLASLHAPVQPPLPKSRPIEQPLRPERPLDYERLSEPVLVTRAKDGDRRALARLCERHAPKIERLSRHLLGDTEDARDAAQESLEKLCSRIRQFRGEARFATWLHRLVVNTCRDVAERQNRRRWEALPEDVGIASEGDPARAVALSELRAELGDCLAALSPEQARILVLKDAFDLSFAEIASAVDMPIGTAKCYAHRARMRLRVRLGASEPTLA
jgi:RNA polymerase sigma-70 factor, ECF subfamily